MPLRRTITSWAYDASRQMIKISRALWNRATFTIREDDLTISDEYDLLTLLSSEDIEELAQLPMDNPTNDEMGKLVESTLKSHVQSHITHLTPSLNSKQLARINRVRRFVSRSKLFDSKVVRMSIESGEDIRWLKGFGVWEEHKFKFSGKNHNEVLKKSQLKYPNPWKQLFVNNNCSNGERITILVKHSSIVNSNTRSKPRVPKAIHYPMLNSVNYVVWAMRMEVVLMVHEAWEGVDT
ncbi:hypothetical protein QVD17_35266 [Tagetes erecta]|uniref:DUF4219 domain-containing protein n=1 Tax=Tagetes erecta TaxID=13708 RepID=A0AAD8NLU6_TARER|nr:hypothetical protein QVD17_35266 [Tagetes erecta]